MEADVTFQCGFEVWEISCKNKEIYDNFNIIMHVNLSNFTKIISMLNNLSRQENFEKWTLNNYNIKKQSENVTITLNISLLSENRFIVFIMKHSEGNLELLQRI